MVLVSCFFFGGIVDFWLFGQSERVHTLTEKVPRNRLKLSYTDLSSNCLLPSRVWNLLHHDVILSRKRGEASCQLLLSQQKTILMLLLLFLVIVGKQSMPALFITLIDATEYLPFWLWPILASFSRSFPFWSLKVRFPYFHATPSFSPFVISFVKSIVIIIAACCIFVFL